MKMAFSFIALTIMFDASGQSNPAIDSLENILRTAKEDTAKVKCLNALSKQYVESGDFRMSMQYADSALDLAKTLDYKKGIADAYSHIGTSYNLQDNYPKALELFLTSFKIYEEIGDKRGIGNSYDNIGNIYFYQGNYPEALKNFLTSLKIFEEIGEKAGIADCYKNIGRIYLQQDNFQEALENFLINLKINEEIGDKKGIGYSYNNIGHIYHNRGKLEKALEYFFTSQKIFEEIGYKVGIAGTNTNIGYVYWHQGDYQEASKYLQISLKISKEIGNDDITAANYGILGDLYIALKNFQEARKYLDDALALSTKMGRKLRIMYDYQSLSTLDYSEGNFAQALEHYKMFIIYKDSLWNEESINKIALMKIQYNTEIKDREIELLYKDNEIKTLQINQQEASLRTSWLEAEKKQNELLLMNKSMEIQKLKLAETQKNLESQQAEARVKAVELELLGKEKMLGEQKLEKQKLLRNGIFAGVFLIILVGLLVFRSVMLRKKLEKQQAVIQERKRISADLHDDVGSGLSRIMLLSELEKKEAKTAQTSKGVEKIAAISSELASNIDEIVWALNSDNDYVENLVAYIRRFAVEYFENSPVRVTIKAPGRMDHIPISGERRRNIFYTVKEALNNILKHAQATETELGFRVKNNVLSVVIKDNGKGFSQGELNRFGNGLKNMRNRMKSINGNLGIENHSGTRITLSVPV